MKRVLVYAPEENFTQEPSFRLRILALVEPMKKRGFDWTIAVRPDSMWGRIKLAHSARNFDAVILHRKMLSPQEVFILRRSRKIYARRHAAQAHAAAQSLRIFMDIDDATMLHEMELGRYARRRLDLRFHITAALLDGLCAGNSYLADLFCRERIASAPLPVHIVPTALNPAEYPIKTHQQQTEQPRLIWLGSSSTLKYLENAFDSLRLAAEKVPGLRLVVICDRPPADPSLPMEFIPWSLAGEKQALLRGDIGIAPTPETAWTLGKCGFKIIQYLAAGLPVIASPVGVNSHLTQGAGLLANSPEEWACAIARLAADVSLRQSFGTAGRRRVESELCTEEMANRWAIALG